MRQQLPLLSLLLVSLLVLTTAEVLAQPSPRSADAAYADAYALYDAGVYAEAARAFETFRRDHPDHSRHADALYYGARAELAAGREARAASLLTRFRQQHPNHPLAGPARLALGEYYFARGDYDRAVTTLREALDEQQPTEEAARAMLMIGQASLRGGHYDAGIAELRLLAESHPRSDVAPRALYAMGVAATERGDFEVAVDAFSRLATRYRRTPEDRMVGLALAEALLRTGQLRRVEDEVQRRLADLPTADHEGGLPLSPSVVAERRARRDRAHFLAGEALLRLGDVGAAAAHFRNVDDEGLLGARASYGRGRAALASDDWLEAATRFDQAARHRHADPTIAAEALYYAGVAYRRAGQLQTASERFAEAVDRQPEGPLADVALFERGMLLYTTRQWEEAVIAFRTIMERYRGSTHVGEAARMLAETYAALGNYAQAEAATREAQELGAVSQEIAVEVEFQRGYRALQAGQLAEAEELLIGVFSAGAAGERAGEALFWAAEAAFQRGQGGQREAFGRAVQRFETFLQRFPEHRQRDAARYALAWAHFRRGDYGAAANAFERFLGAYRPGSEIVPYTADARLRLADSYFALRRWDDAARSYGQVQGAGGDYARFQIGQAHANAGRYAEAAAAYNRLLEDFPQSSLRPQARYALGDLRFQQGDYDQAVVFFEEVVRQHPNSPIAARAQFAIGDARYNQGRMQEAVAAYRLILERYPGSTLVPDAISAIEMALGALGRDDEVARIIDAYEARNPGAVAVEELRLRQAESRFQRGDFRGAIEDLQGLISSTRDREVLPPALLYLGRAHAQAGDSRAAEAQYRRIVDQHHESPLRGEAARRLGQILLDQERYDEALTRFSLAADLAESRNEGVEARLGMASALTGLGRHREAEPLLEAAAAEAPSPSVAARARLRLANLYERTGRHSAAGDAYRALAREDTGLPGAQAAASLVALLLAQNDPHGVLQATDELRVEERFAGFPEATAQMLLGRARAFRQLGQPGPAQETFERILRAYPETPAATQARRERDA